MNKFNIFIISFILVFTFGFTSAVLAASTQVDGQNYIITASAKEFDMEMTNNKKVRGGFLAQVKNAVSNCEAALTGEEKSNGLTCEAYSLVEPYKNSEGEVSGMVSVLVGAYGFPYCQLDGQSCAGADETCCPTCNCENGTCRDNLKKFNFSTILDRLNR